MLDSGTEGEQDKTAAMKISEKVTNARESEPRSPHRSVLG